MSSTRIAKPGSPRRQERFASSPAFEKGLKGNLVAKRCALLDDSETQELLWFIQDQSHSPGGLNALVEALLEANPEAHVTPLMRKFGAAAGARWTGDQMWQVCMEGELLGWGRRENKDDFLRNWEGLPWDHAVFPADDAISASKRAALERLPRLLEDACLDPCSNLSDDAPNCFQGLRSALFRLMQNHAVGLRAAEVVTSVGRKIEDACRFAWKTRSLAVVNGCARIGKTHAARLWCEMHPGRARFAQVPSSNDDIGFYRAIAIALGVSINLNAKAQELRMRIEEVLQTGQLLLCLDEAHYLLPQSNYRDALPQRINWLMTALVNHRVPTVLIVTPQFFTHQRRIEEKTFWTGQQFTGRVSRYVGLPDDALTEEDLRAVAGKLLPGECSREVEILAKVAKVSAKYLAAIDSTVRAARYFAEEAGRASMTGADIRKAIGEVMPSDKALSEVLNGDRSRGRAAALVTPHVGRTSAAPQLPQRPIRDANFQESEATARRGVIPDLDVALPD